MLKDTNMTPTSRTSSAIDQGSGDSISGCGPAHPCKPHCWNVRNVLIKALLLVFLAWIEVLLNDLVLIYGLFLTCYQRHVPKCNENVGEDEVELQKLELDSLLPEVKGRILEHLDHEDVFKPKSLSKSWKALIENLEFIQALALKAKPVLTTCSFFIHEGVRQWAAFDPNWNSTSGHKGKWQKLPPLTFLPPNCDPDSDLFKQFFFCANEGLVCMNFSKSPHGERLIVFNPLTQEWKELPLLFCWLNLVLMHMYVDQSSKSYHIFVGGFASSSEESLSRVMELYDSRIGQWEGVGDFLGPTFTLNEYQPRVFQNGNIFCIGFMKLGDQTVKGILGYNMEEGIWSTKWIAEALPNSSILQLVENDGDLFSFSERDNGPDTEHWVYRIGWTQSKEAYEKKNDTFMLVNVLKEEKSGGRSLEMYPKFSLVPFTESQLCIYSSIDHSREVFDTGDEEKCEALLALPEGFPVIISVIPEHSSPHRNSLDHSRLNFLGFTVLHDTIHVRISSVGRLIAAQNPDGEKTSLWRKLQAWGDSYLGSVIELNGMKVRLLSFKPLRTIKKQTKGDPSFWCSILRVLGFLSCLRAVGASPASAPGSLPSSQLSSTYPTFFYVGVAATIIGTAIAVLSLGVNLFYHRRGRGDGLRGVLNVLTRPFREHPRGLCMFVRSLRVGEASLDDLQLVLPV